MVESLVQAMLGSVLGIGLGLAALAVFCRVADWQFGVNPVTVLLAVGYGALVGLGFGVYPAWRAGRVDPIASLRSEF
jgi:putative ABC transport system permease protein